VQLEDLKRFASDRGVRPQVCQGAGGNIMKEIPLTKGKVTCVDDDDYVELSKYKWSAYCRLGLWYAMRSEKPRLMHRYILGLENGDGKIVDHIDRNPLNNTRSNLRLATYQQNIVNRKLSKTNTSGFRGICKIKERWRAGIRCNGKTLDLGMYPTKEQAATAYDFKAKELFGDFVTLNFPNDIPNKQNVKYSPTKKYLYSNFLNFTFGIYDFYLLSRQYIPPKIKILKQCGVQSVYRLRSRSYGGIKSFKNFLDYIYRNSYIQTPHPPRSKSGFYGVKYNKRNNNWLVTINHKHIGRCATPENAARVYDATVWKLYGDRAILNFPNDIPDPLCIDKLKNKRYNKGYLPKSGFRGVCQDCKTKKFIVKIDYNYHKIHLGSYRTAEIGAKVYDYAANALFGNQAILNFPNEPLDEQYTFQKNKSQLYFCLNFLFGYPIKFGYTHKEKLLSRSRLYKVINLIYGYPIDYIYTKPKEIEIKKHHINKILNLIYGYPLLYNYLPPHPMKIRKPVKKKIFKDREVGINLYNFITFTYQSDSTSYQYMVGWIHRMRKINREEL